MIALHGSMKTKNSIFFSISLAVLAVSFFLPGLASASVNTTLYIQGPGGSVLVNTALVVPESCTVVDNVGVSHAFSGHRAPCAIKAAKDENLISSFEFKDFGGSLGLFLKSINGIADGPAPDYPYWNLWKNGISSDIGISGIVLAQGDNFQLTYGPWLTEIIRAPQVSGGPVITDIYPKRQRLRMEDAVSFLVMNQQDDGSFGHALFSDWVAIALGSYKGNSASAFYAKNALLQWMEKNPVPAGSTITDFERRAMALMALGIDPYNGTGVDYIQAILNGFDGEQFGSPSLVNDDVFALLVLLKAGYQEYEEPVVGALQLIIASQRENGSWGDVDLTSAVIQMLDLFSSTKERDQALLRAKKYLEGKQESTGGFGNVYSTSWALQAISAMQGNGDSWVIDNRTPEHFLALRQALDGGLLQTESKENRIWATAYAIPAALGKPWSSVLVQFQRPLLSQVRTVVAPLASEDLQRIEQEVQRISGEVAVLQTEVFAFVALAHVEQELERIALETKAVQVGIVQLKIQQIDKLVEQPPSQDLSGVTLLLEDAVAPYGAGVGEAVGAQGLSPQLIILLVVIGVAIFAFSGGANAILPLLRRTFSKV